MSRRTERPYKVDGAGKLAPHSAAQCSAPEINGPAVQQKFTSLLRETCSPSPSATVGAVASNGCRAGAGVSRGRSTESNEPGAVYRPSNEETGRTHNSGRAELGRQNTTIGGLVPEALTPTGRATGSDHRGRERVAASIRKDCQEPPYADPHVRWCGRREGKLSRRPDSASSVKNSLSTMATLTCLRDA